MIIRFIVLLLVGTYTTDAVHAETFELPPEGVDVVGAIASTTTKYDQTLIDIAREHGLGYQDIVRANPDVNVWVPGEGTEVVLPTQYVLPSVERRGIVLNLAEYRLYYFPDPNPGEPAVVMTYPISIGRMDWETPLGLTNVVSKSINPTWYPPQSVRDEHAAQGRPLDKVVPPGPDNPLGERAMRLGLPGYLIHGTNRPAGVGMRVTHGCLRMFPEDIKFLFGFIAINTPVRIINQPVKMGWQGDKLVMEVHPLLDSSSAATTDEPVPGSREVLSLAPEYLPVPDNAENTVELVAPDDVAELNDTVQANNDASDDNKHKDDGDAPQGHFLRGAPQGHFLRGAPVIDEKLAKNPLTYVTEQFVVATKERAGRLDWRLAETVLGRANGMPELVGAGIKNAATSAASK